MANNNFLSSPFDSVAVSSEFTDTPPAQVETPKPKATAAVVTPRVSAPSKNDLIARANELGVDPNLALSFFSQESSGNWNSKDSPKGARGGMQVMPGTFKMMMGTAAGQDDPWQNMEAGLRYIRYGQTKLKTKDPELLAAGYHAGYDNPSLARGQIPNTNDGMINTRDYAKSVAGRLGKSSKTASIDDEFSDTPPKLTDADFSDTPVAVDKSNDDAWDAEFAKQKVDAKPYWDRLKDETKAGFGDMVRSIDTARWALGSGDDTDIAKQIADNIQAQSKATKNKSQQEIDAAYKQVTDANGVIDTTAAGAKALYTSITNPSETFIEVARNAANALPTIGAGAAGAGAGAAAGSVIPGAGTALGAVLGGRAGMIAGTTATELGAEIQDMIGKRLESNNQAPTAQNVLAIISDQKFKEEARKQGLAKGLTVAAVDQVFFGIGGKVATAPARKLATRDLAAQGVDVSTRAARNQALSSAAGQTALQAAKPSIAARAGAGAAAIGIDAGGETLGEGLSQKVARGEVDYGDALREGVTSLGQSAVEVGISAATQGYRAGAQAAKSIVQPTKSEAAGPLARAAENAAAENERVTVTAPTGEKVTGEVTGKAEDGTTQVTTDDGQQVTFKVGENGITMEPEAPNTPLSNAVEAAAAEQPARSNIESGPATWNSADYDYNVDVVGIEPQPGPDGRTYARVVMDGKESFVPADELKPRAEVKAETAAPQQAAPTETIERPAPQAKVDYKTMSEPELKSRLDYLKNQAKTNGGWNKLLYTERRAVENAISKLPKPDETEVKQFAPETGTLGIPRAEMPQVKSEHHGALVNHLNAQGIAHETTTVDAATLKPTQAEYSPAKVERAKEEGNGERSIIVSSDNHIIDGHHQAVAAAEKGEQVKAIVLDAPAEQALEAVKAFPSATTEGKPQKASKEDINHLFGLDEKRAKALERIAAGRAWFNDGVKAKDFIKKNDLTDTHEAKKGKGGRWDIVAKATAEKSSEAPTVRESLTVQSATQQETVNVNDERTQQQPNGREEGQRTEAAAPAAVQSDAAEEVGKYHVVAVNDKTGEATRMTNTPVTEREGNTIISKNTERPGRTLELQEVKGSRGKPQTRSVTNPDGSYYRIEVSPQYVAYENWIGDGKEVSDGMREQIAKDERLNDGEADRLLALADKHAKPKTTSIPQTVTDPAKAKEGDIIESGGVKFRKTANGFERVADEPSAETKEADQPKAKRPQPGEDGYTLAMAKDDLSALYQQKNRTGIIESARLNDRIDMMKKVVDDMEREAEKPTEPSPPTGTKADPFAGNKLFTTDKVAAARARMKEKLAGTQLNSGIDPELLMDGMVIAGAYVESGVRNFADYASRMVDDLGDGVKPYLLSFWEAARNYPGIDNKDMTSVRESARAHAAMMEKPAAAANVEPVKESDDGNTNTAPSAGSAGDRALEGKPAEDVPSAEAVGNAEQSGNGSGAENTGRAGNADRKRNTPRGRVGNGAGDVSVPAGRARSQRGSTQQSGLFDQPPAEQADQRDVEVKQARESKPAGANYKITDLTKLGEGGQKTKYRNNVAAIKLLNELQEAGRQATAEEQDTLARYVGWGGLAQAFDAANSEWSKEHAELKELLTPEEWESAKESTQYAHYTSQEIIGGIYDALKRFGFGGGTALEPGSGVGNFMGMLPDALRGNTRFTAVERERIAGGIAKLLYPNHNVQQEDFRSFNAQDGYFDVAIGNPPFSATTLTDLTGRKHLSGLSIHNYFFAKSIDMLREGGVLAMVVSNAFMDAKTDRARKYIGDRAELLGAIRLPNNAFAKNANTEVTTDIIFLKKRPENEWGSKAAKEDMRRWVDIGSISDPRGGESIPVNRYFIDNPSMMLGRMERSGSMYRADAPALVAREGQDTASLLKQAIQNLPEGVYEAVATANTAKMEDAAIEKLSDKATVDVGGHYVDGDKLYVRMPDVAGEGRAMQLTATTKISEKKDLGKNGLDRLKSLAQMRVTLRSLLSAELKDASNMESLRKQLNTEYDAYVKQFGYINQRGTIQLYGDDPDFPLLASLELSYDPGISRAAAEKQGVKAQEPSAKKAAIFKQRVIPKYEEVTSAETPEDALFVSIAERGQIDAAYIGKLLGQDGEAVLKDLASQKNPSVFIDPATGGYALKDAYLSGNVRKKMEQAKAAGMFQNVAALEAVIPEDIPAHEISGKIGAPWVPVETYEEFAKTIMGEGTTAKITYVPALSSYVANFAPGSDVSNKNTYGTSRMGADEIMSALLNSKEIKVGHYEEEPGGGRRFVLEKEPTDEANDKAREIKDKFADWLFADGERSEKLQRAYNDAVNNYVTREFDGSMLKFPGKVPDSIIKLRRHQRNAVARIVQDGRALLDHVVGAGKTFTVIAAAMELKRTGLAKKPMIAVPNHLVKQWAADFYRLYPGANILTATKKDFERANRRKFLAKIATGNWDAVIMAHSSFGFIKPEPEFEIRFNAERVSEIIEAMQALKDEKDQNSKRTVKQLAKMKEGLENKLASLRDRPMDDLLDFGQIGVDQLFVDEAHLFKNLMYVTKMQNVRGLGQAKGSQRAYDMFIKTHQLYDNSENGRGVVFATGTPVSNSLAEMYHMLRYLAPETLKDSGQFTFDAWAKTFADVEQVWMQSLSGDGYKASNRMSVFANTPELLKVFDQVADTVTIDDIKKAYAEENGGKEFPIPPLKGGRRTPVSIPKSAAQNAYMAEIGERAKKLEQRKGKPQKGDDNMLSIMGDARKAAMDIRMVRPDITQRDPEGRIAVAARNVYDRYVKYNDVRGTQLIFSDMGTPKKSAEKELKEYNDLMAETAPLRDERVQAMADLGDESALDQIEKAEEAQRKIDAKGQDWADAIKMAMRGFSIYDDMKDALIELGIPENEIAFIHDYNTDDQKAALFRAVNDGKVRVLLGSTEKMGAGTNVQERAVALHHLDVPWKPSDIEQREGRVIRQGNSLITPDSPNYTPGFEVEVMAYATQDTLDLFMWQTQEKKLSMIGQLRTGNVGREVDNAFEEMQMSAGEMQAAATSNPYLLEEIQLKDRIKKLERQKRSFDGQKNDLANRLAKAQRDIEQLPDSIKKAEGIEAKAMKATEDMRADFKSMTATVNGETITGAMDIRSAVREAVWSAPEIEKDGKTVRDIKIEFNGKEYKSESGVSEAVIKALGDAAEASFTLPDGTKSYRGSETAAALFDTVSSMQDGDEKKLGSIGAFDVVAYQYQGVREANLELDGTSVASEILPKDLEMLMGRLRSMPAKFRDALNNQRGLPDYLRSKLENAKRARSEIEAMPAAGAWEGEKDLKAAREKYKEVLKKLAERESDKGTDTAAFSRSSDLVDVFAGLEAGGIAKIKAERLLAGMPNADRIQFIENNFFEILGELDDSGKVIIKC